MRQEDLKCGPAIPGLLTPIYLDGEYSNEFINGMVVGMLRSYHYHGPVSENATRPDTMKEVNALWDKYRRTGNGEWLVDAANFLMIEFMFPRYRRAYSRATKANPRRINVNQTHRRS